MEDNVVGKSAGESGPAAYWSAADSETAISQGWDLFYVDAAVGEVMAIERWVESDAFKDDGEAIRFVVDRALAGDKLAAKAVFLHNTSTTQPVIMPANLD